MTVSGPFASKNETEEVDAEAASANGSGRSEGLPSEGSVPGDDPVEIDLRDGRVRGHFGVDDAGDTGDSPAAGGSGDSGYADDAGDLSGSTVHAGGSPSARDVVEESSTVPGARLPGARAYDDSRLLSAVAPGSVTRFVRRLVMPAALTLLVACILAIGSFQFARLRTSAAQDVDAAMDRELSVQRDIDDVWAGLLGLAANGVGQEVATLAEVTTAVGRATSNSPESGSDSTGSDGKGDSDLLREAQRTHRAFVSSAAEVLEADGGSPLSVANELQGLAAARSAAQQDLADYAASLSEQRGDLEAEAALWSWISVGLLAGGLVGAAALAFQAKRKVEDHMEGPARSVAAAVAGFADGAVDSRSGVISQAGLGPMASSIDAGLDSISLSMTALRDRAEWGERSAMIFEALDDSQDEMAAYRVVERALGMIDDDHHPVELLISDRGSNRIRSVANDPLAGPVGNVIVDANITCLAMRRGQVSVFPSSNSINACPMIRDRPEGACSAVCVPISVGGRPIGVFHMIGPEFAPPRDEVISRLVSLSVQLGNRLGALRTLETTRKEASTDGLTGLPNRRMLQGEVESLMTSETPFVMVLADLDKFKRLNDNYGHEVGDKALKLFADVLKKNVRGNDLVARIGGEEFVLVYPNMSVETSIEAIGRLRHALAGAVAASRLPAFTCSFGVSDSNAGSDGESILRVADAGLLKAKELGGDQAVYAQADLVDEIFGEGAERPESDPDRR